MDLEGPATLPIGPSPWWFWEVFCPICPVREKKTCNFFGARCTIISCRCQRWKSTVFHRFIGSFSTPFDNCECVTCKKKGPFSPVEKWPFLPPGSAETLLVTFRSLTSWNVTSLVTDLGICVTNIRARDLGTFQGAMVVIQEELLQWNGYHGTWMVVSIGTPAMPDMDG